MHIIKISRLFLPFFLLGMEPSGFAQNYSVSTLAGSGSAGYGDGNGTSASFNDPNGVAVDGSGNLYVADRVNHRIRKITPSGSVTTMAGSGSAGYADGNGTSASFNGPIGVAVDGNDNVYVADQNNDRIRKITPSGSVTTLAGSGSAGYADGNGTSASFSAPFDVAVDGNGNVYVSDAMNARIRKITPSGSVTTLAGSGDRAHADGNGTSASFSPPMGVAVDGSGNLYVGDLGNERVRKITPSGSVTTLAGSGSKGYADGNGTSASFNRPCAVAVDDVGNIYVGDYWNNRIRKITPSGSVTTLAGSGSAGYADGNGTSASFNGPGGVAVDGSGNVYVADSENNRIRKIALDNTGSGGSSSGGSSSGGSSSGGSGRGFGSKKYGSSKISFNKSSGISKKSSSAKKSKVSKKSKK
jgi:sugar lactone lactonase YvrE